VNLLIDPDTLKTELAAIKAESIFWLPLGESAYLHMGDPEALANEGTEREIVITVVGVPDATMAGMNVLLVG